MVNTYSYGSLIACPLCKSKDFKILYASTFTPKDFSQKAMVKHLKNSLDNYTKHGQIVKCRNCSLVYTNPMEDLKKIESAYEDVEDKEYLQTEKFRKILLSQHLNLVERFSKIGKILDVGAFAGYFLELAKEHGWEGVGVEPSQWATKEAKKRGVTIVGKTLNDVKTSKAYDAIVLWDVIEHLPNPKKSMEQIKKIIKKNGIIVMSTPNIDSMFARVTGSRCPFFIRMHFILYSPKTLRKLFEDNGFKVIYCGNYSRTFPVWYILDHLNINNFLYDNLKKVVKKIKILNNLTIKIPLQESFVMVAKNEN